RVFSKSIPSANAGPCIVSSSKAKPCQRFMGEKLNMNASELMRTAVQRGERVSVADQSSQGMLPPSSDVRNCPQLGIHERCKSIDEHLQSIGSDVLLCCTRGASAVGPSKANRQTIASLTDPRISAALCYAARRTPLPPAGSP